MGEEKHIEAFHARVELPQKYSFFFLVTFSSPYYVLHISKMFVGTCYVKASATLNRNNKTESNTQKACKKFIPF